MESVNQRLFASCLALPEHLVIAALQPAATSLIVSLSCRHPTAACPVCQQPFQRIHGSYRRTVADVPRAGACGYLLKDTSWETLLDAIRTAARGETLLQPVAGFLVSTAKLYSRQVGSDTGMPFEGQEQPVSPVAEPAPSLHMA